jgi:hypothetical protein
MQEESDLFRVRLNERGKKFIRKFAAISYTMFVLVIFEFLISVYWNIRILTINSQGLFSTLYDKVYPYFYILLSLATVVSNIYYLRFPRALFRSIKINDEFGANEAFRLLYRGAMIYFISLLLSSASMIWSLSLTRHN